MTTLVVSKPATQVAKMSVVSNQSINNNLPVEGTFRFLYKAGKPLFFIDGEGKQVNKNGMPVYQDKTSKFNFVNEAMYQIEGMLNIFTKKNVAFLLFVLSSEEILPQDFLVVGEFTMSHNEKDPLFKFSNYKIAPLNAEGEGKLILPSFESRKSFITGKTYSVEGVVRIYSGKSFGTFMPSSVKEVNPRTHEGLKASLTIAKKFEKDLYELPIEEMVRKAFDINDSNVWTALVKYVNTHANEVILTDYVWNKILTQNLDHATRLKVMQKLAKSSSQAVA
jgi:hypothetical protein